MNVDQILLSDQSHILQNIYKRYKITIDHSRIYHLK